ncbi:hypothetical protein COT72_05115 [archaeon CG10_big_fil_rev_8_21_14_0_10_43_11]|nr:MAG: hypothetical protein COT72_05115 [archaeon CG10_big_fil_rev_8_21_14_0_10_43_11]
MGILIISGCTGQGAQETDTGASSSAGGYGLIIPEFYTDIARLEAGDTALIVLNVTNLDNEFARDVTARIFPAGMEISESDREQSEFEIAPQDSTVFEFDLQAARNLNIDRTYTPYAEVCYNYLATGSAALFVIDNDFYTSDTQIPDIPPASSLGPIEVTVDPGTRLNIRKTEQGVIEGRNRTIRLELANIDTGYVINGSTGFVSNAVERNRVATRALDLRITATSDAKATISELENEGQVFACSTDSVTAQSELYEQAYGISTNGADTIYCTNIDDISFGSTGTGKSLRLPIEFTVNQGGQDTVFFEATLDYRYCIQSPQISLLAQRVN